MFRKFGIMLLDKQLMVD